MWQCHYSFDDSALPNTQSKFKRLGSYIAACGNPCVNHSFSHVYKFASTYCSTAPPRACLKTHYEYALWYSWVVMFRNLQASSGLLTKCMKALRTRRAMPASRGRRHVTRVCSTTLSSLSSRRDSSTSTSKSSSSTKLLGNERYWWANP